jgi:hypothetical protein
MPRKNATKRQKTHARSQSPASATQVVSQPIQAEIEPCEAPDRATDSKDEPDISKPNRFLLWMQTWSQIIINGLLLVVITFQAYIYNQQWQAMLKQSELMNKQLELMNMGERPYIRIKEINRFDFVAGQKPTVEVMFENAGRTPAFKAVLETRMVITDKPLPENPDWSIADTAGSPSPNFMPANANVPQMLTKSYALTIEQVESLNSKQSFFYVFGRGQYYDGLDRRYTMKFCSYYDPSFPKLVTCPQHNSSD